VTVQVEGYSVNIEHDPLGYLVIVSKKINEKTYSARSLISDLACSADPNVMIQTMNQCMKVLQKQEKEIMIKEIYNPSFRRKRNDQQNQNV